MGSRGGRASRRTVGAAIDEALDRISAPEPFVESARTALECAVSEIERSTWPAAVPCWSGLNADGFPIELAFSSRDRDVRWTSEAAPPEVPESERLARACALIEALGGAPIDTAARAAIERAQRRGRLRWSASISGRHGPSGGRLKLYAEVPAPDAERATDEFLDEDVRHARLMRPLRPVMVGWEPGRGSGRWDRYFRSEGLAPGEAQRVLDVLGFSDRAPELVCAVEEAAEGSFERALESRWGIGVAGPFAGGDAEAVSLFKEANRLLGVDGRARRHLLALVERLDAGSLDDYASVSAPLAERSHSGAHGILAFTVARGRRLELRIGLSPAAIQRSAAAGGA